jgi:alkylated DNA repair protein alkB family protein 7
MIIAPHALSRCHLRSVRSFGALFATSVNADEILPDPTHVNLQNAPASFDKASAVVYPHFITEEEGKSFIKEVSKRMKRRRFEQGHWDSVIVGYREVELMIHDDLANGSSSMPEEHTSPLFIDAIRKTRQHLEARHFDNNRHGSIKWIPCHAIDLSADGRLDAHVDSIKFSGDIVAGISFLSDSIMRLRPCSDEWKSGSDEVKASQASDFGHVDLYLPKQSLYVLSGMSRFSYTHELLPSGSTFEFMSLDESISVDRGRRVSIIFRDELKSQST